MQEQKLRPKVENIFYLKITKFSKFDLFLSKMDIFRLLKKILYQYKFIGWSKINFCVEKFPFLVVKSSVTVRLWFGGFGYGSAFGSAEPKIRGSVDHYIKPIK